MRKLISVIVILFSVHASEAQLRPLWRSELNAGIVVGEKGDYFHGTAVTGLKYRGWYSGVGAGLDMYRFKTVPLFIALNKQFTSNPSGFYAFANGGINFPSGEVQRPDWVDSKFRPSIYTATGLGYRVGWKNRREVLLLNAGYSFKRLKEKQTQVSPCLFPPCPETVNNYNYDMNTWIMRFGLQF